MVVLAVSRLAMRIARVVALIASTMALSLPRWMWLARLLSTTPVSEPPLVSKRDGRHRGSRWRPVSFRAMMTRYSMHMPLIGLLLFSSVAAFGQCSTERGEINRILQQIANGHASEAFENYTNLNQSKIDPRSKLAVCIEAYMANDTALFRSILVDLMCHHGYRNDATTVGMAFSQDITRGGQSYWFKSVEDSCYAAFEHVNPHRKPVIRALNDLYAQDQLKLPNAHLRDAEVNDSIIHAIRMENFHNLVQLCEEHGLPNGFDDAYDSGGLVELILLHASNTPEDFGESWRHIMPFIDRAFSEGKGDNGFAYIYDYFSQIHFGNQYYGTLDDSIPIVDPEHLPQRKSKYCLK